MDEQIKQRFLLSGLFDIYEPMLTRKQSGAFRLHFLDDWSLSEVAERLEVTRQGAHDLVQRARERLLDTEELLGFTVREAFWEKRMNDLKSWAERFSGEISPDAAKVFKDLLRDDDRGVESS
ncbi:MAG: sigma factor-like helix-turn-helix DNA-binding protein [Thermovirgaceae bacterium]|nr:sigma factor-like helix-turn-helix DNA-binding protein [Thermovirgaceae bacterium]